MMKLSQETEQAVSPWCKYRDQHYSPELHLRCSSSASPGWHLNHCSLILFTALPLLQCHSSKVTNSTGSQDLHLQSGSGSWAMLSWAAHLTSGPQSLHLWNGIVIPTSQGYYKNYRGRLCTWLYKVSTFKKWWLWLTERRKWHHC